MVLTVCIELSAQYDERVLNEAMILADAVVENSRYGVGLVRQPVGAIGAGGTGRVGDGLDQPATATAAANRGVDVQIL